MTHKNITGIVLAGGKSSRMGTEKGILKVGGKMMIEHVLNALTPVVNKIMIIANTDYYNKLGYPVYPDIIKNCGPMGGIYTGLFYSTTDRSMVVSCDIPYISSNILAYIISKSTTHEITVPKHNNKLEPLCAVYSKINLDKFKELLNKKKWKLQDALLHFNTFPLTIPKEIRSEKNFMNINTPNDFNRIN